MKKIIAYEDDHALREQLRKIFNELRDSYWLVKTFPNTVTLDKDLDTYTPDLVLMDLQMVAEDDGLVALHRIKSTRPHIKVLVLTMFDQDNKVFNAICLDADGYMLKSDFTGNKLPKEVMRQSLDTTFSGGAYLTPSVAKQILEIYKDRGIADKIEAVKETFTKLFSGKSKNEDPKKTPLTRMQLIVLQQIVEGKKSSEIARDLNLTENTINSHIKGIYQNLGVQNRAKAIKKAIEKKLIF